jgi:antitoxin MazE
MKTAVQQWGNSLAVRIPKAFANQARVRKGTPVRISLEKGRMILTPVNERTPSLKQLLARVTKENIHAETDWGFAQGKELW